MPGSGWTYSVPLIWLAIWFGKCRHEHAEVQPDEVQSRNGGPVVMIFTIAQSAPPLNRVSEGVVRRVGRPLLIDEV